MSADAEFSATVSELLRRRPHYSPHFEQHLEIRREAEQYEATQVETDPIAQAVAGWIGLNPSDPERTKQLLDATYLASPSAISTDLQLEVGSEHAVRRNDPKRLLPTEVGFNALLEVLTDETHSMVLLTGYRGSGKSHATNYFFARHFQSELQPVNITYFRCDASKLEDVRKSLSPLAKEQGSVTIREYLRAHNLYVALKHGKDDKVLRAFDRDIQRENRTDSFLAVLSLKGKDDPAYQFWQLWCTHPLLDSSADDVTPIEFVAEVISAERQGAQQGSMRLAAAMFNHIRQNGGRVILVIDGVDNYSPETDQKLYESLMEELTSFFPKGNHDSYFKVVLSIRVLTYHDLLIRLGHTARDKAYTTFLIGTIAPQAFLEHRISALPDRKSIGEAHFQGAPNWDRELLQFSKRLLERLRQAIGDKNNNAPSADAELMQKIFFGNLRSYKRNLLQAYRYCKSICRTTGINLPKLSHRIPLEASVLGGGVFMPVWGEEDKPLSRGRWCPNLFYFLQRGSETNASNDQWDGLALLRILQLLAKPGSALALVEIQDTLQHDFGYGPGTTKKLFLRALRFGLVTFDKVKTIGQDGRSELAYRRSIKGDALLIRVFEEPNLFYLMAASALWPVDWLDNSNKIFLHSTTTSDRQFYVASIKTGISFWQLLKTEHAREMKFRQFGKDAESQTRFKEFRARYELPRHAKWFENLEWNFQSLRRLQPSKAKALLDDLKGQLVDESEVVDNCQNLHSRSVNKARRRKKK